MVEVTFRSDMGVELIDHMGSDHRVAEAARVSTLGSKPSESKEYGGLINFLMRDRHASPFESCIMQFRTTAPIFVWREHMRHRISSYSEESGRYKQLDPIFYIPNHQRKLVQTGKVGAYQFEDGTREQYLNMQDELIVNSTAAYRAYERLLEDGTAREVARMALPVNIYSTAYVTMNLRSLMNFLSLRNFTEDSSVPTFPQREIEMVAELYEKEFESHFPLIHKAFVKNGRISA